MDMPDALEAIAELRNVAVALEQSDDPALARHAAAIRTYETEAPTGRTLDDVLGLAQRGGAGPWWIQEARTRRDQAIRRVREGFYGNHELTEAIGEIERLAARRMMARTPPVNHKEELIDAALRTGVKFPGRQRLRELLTSAA
jgi:hypothetical protein